jgi:glycosyltransferase involved in cell wall biosynthesis
MPTAEAGLVSVLIPTYDGERFLTETLRSVAAQTHQELEIVICDDGSSDATVEIARRFAAEDPRVRLHLEGGHVGPVANFARCLDLAAGPYVKFLMQDDVLVPHAIERLLGALRESDDVVLATSRRIRIDELGRPLPERPEVAAAYEVDTVVAGTALGDLVLQENLNLIGEPSTVLFRRDALGGDAPFHLGGTAYRYLADVALWLTLLERGRAAYLVEPLSRSRAHPDQDSATRAIMVVSILEWDRLRTDAAANGFLAAPGAAGRARGRWLANAPFFFRFSTGPSQAWALARRIVSANAAAARDGSRSRWRALAGSARAVATFPLAAVLADPVHRARRRARPGRSA